MGALGAIVAVDPGCLHTGIVYMDERRVIDSRTIGSVSYTHLDVYKRQASRR